jgi:hypothetical protein
MGKDDSPNAIDTRDPKTWPTRYKAAAKVGVSVRTLDRMVLNGEVKPVLVDGTRRFNPSELDEIAPEGDVSAEFRQVLEVVNDSLKLAQEHAKALFSMVTTPSKAVLDLLQEEVQRLRARATQLEDKHLDMVQSYEKVLSASNDRELQRAKTLAEQQRADKAAQLFFDLAPVLADQVLGGSKVNKLLLSLSNDQVEALKAAGFLSDEQFAIIDEVRRKRTQPIAKESEAPNAAE